MVSVRAWLRVGWIGAAAVVALAVAPGPIRGQDAEDPDSEAVRAVREALSAGNYPWYDAEGDAFRAVAPPPPPRNPTPPNRSRTGWGEFSIQDLGQLIIFVLLSAGLVALIVLLARHWQRRLEREELAGPVLGPARPAARIGTLPTGLDVDESDPWEAARRLRARGDYARAVVLLFAHQLLTLDRLGLIRLAPGRTGRQLVRSIPDPDIRRALQRTLRLFEDVYYGHRDPEPDAFESVWAEAEALEDRLASRAAP